MSKGAGVRANSSHSIPGRGPPFSNIAVLIHIIGGGDQWGIHQNPFSHLWDLEILKIRFVKSHQALKVLSCLQETCAVSKFKGPDAFLTFLNETKIKQKPDLKTQATKTHLWRNSADKFDQRVSIWRSIGTPWALLSSRFSASASKVGSKATHEWPK